MTKQEKAAIRARENALAEHIKTAEMSNAQYLFHIDPPSVADEGDELSIQVRLRSRLKMLAPTVRLVAFPNAAKRTAWSAMKAKAEGLSAGMPDLEALWSNGGGGAVIAGHAYLEMKDRKGTLTPNQIDWLNWLHANGHPCGLFRSVDTAIEFLRRSGAPFLFNQE